MKKPAPPKDKEREKLEADIAAFLSGGGKIKEIEKGVSGYRGNDRNRPGKKKETPTPVNVKAS